MYTTLSGQLGIAKQIDIIANNLANMNTSGYKAERMLFEKVMDKQHAVLPPTIRSSEQGPQQAFDTEDYMGVRGTYTDFTQGPIEKTSNPLDVAIQGDGFFVVQTENGERYTRAGNFRLDSTGQLVTQAGHPVQGQGGNITITKSPVTVRDNGSISSADEEFGRLRIVKFAPGTLARDESGNMLFAPKDGAAPQEVAAPTVAGGAVEGSNVNPVQELANMILAQRLFQSFEKSEDSASRMNQLRNQLGTTQG